MANRLFDAMMGRPAPSGAQPTHSPAAPQQAAQGQQISPQDAMRQLRADPAGMIRQAGFNVPDEYASDPQAAVMYILRSGQVRPRR